MADQVLSIHLPESAEERALVGHIYQAVSALLLGDDLPSLGVSGATITGGDDRATTATGRTFEGAQDDANLRLFLREITANARRFLHAVADETLTTGQPVPSTRVREITGATTPPQVAGWIASIGFAQKRLEFADRPYSQHWTYTGAATNSGWENTYTMDPQIAEQIRQLVGSDGSFTNK